MQAFSFLCLLIYINSHLRIAGSTWILGHKVFNKHRPLNTCSQVCFNTAKIIKPATGKSNKVSQEALPGVGGRLYPEKHGQVGLGYTPWHPNVLNRIDNSGRKSYVGENFGGQFVVLVRDEDSFHNVCFFNNLRGCFVFSSKSYFVLRFFTQLDFSLLHVTNFCYFINY